MVNPSDIKDYLDGIEFPISKEDLIKHVREKGADDKLVGMIEKLPTDEIKSPGDIIKSANPFD